MTMNRGRFLRAAAPFAARAAFCAFFVWCVPPQAPPAAAPTRTAAAKHYVCPPCGQACDGAVYDHPGKCPTCGMPLVEQGANAAEAAPQPKKRVAVLVFDGAEIIDFSGPWEVFGAAGYDVYSVAETRAPVTTSMGMKVVPDHTFADAPQPAVLVVPGGSVQDARKSEATLKWVRDASGGTEQTLSVCNGAFILASAGLLDGLGATTTYRLIPRLAEQFPKTKVVSDRRYVDNGKIVTAAGLSSGIDGALHVLEKLEGRGTAEGVALQIEYDWHPDGTFVRARLADHLIPPADLEDAGTWAFDKTEGTTDRWDMVIRGTSPRTAEALHALLGQAFTEKGKWRSVGSKPTSSDWRFEDEEGKPWAGTLAVEGEKSAYVIRISVARAP